MYVHGFSQMLVGFFQANKHHKPVSDDHTAAVYGAYEGVAAMKVVYQCKLSRSPHQKPEHMPDIGPNVKSSSQIHVTLQDMLHY